MDVVKKAFEFYITPVMGANEFFVQSLDEGFIDLFEMYKFRVNAKNQKSDFEIKCYKLVPIEKGEE